MTENEKIAIMNQFMLNFVGSKVTKRAKLLNPLEMRDKVNERESKLWHLQS